MKSPQQIAEEEIVNDIYAAYGTHSGILFGIKERSIVDTIVKFTISRLPAQQAGEGLREWIDVKDRLPEKGEIVLCWRKSSFLDDTYFPEIGSYMFFNDGIWGGCEDDNWDVTHWMPLPPPPNFSKQETEL